MTIDKFEKEYKKIQAESNELYCQLKPLLKKIKSLASKAEKLGKQVDIDTSLYEEYSNEPECKGDWNVDVVYRLFDLAYVMDFCEDLDAAFHNIKGTKFFNNKKKKK